jgi:hypothetical protein
LTKNPAYYYANIPTYPGGGIGFMYVSDTPWENGLKTPYPPGVNNYINPEIHKAAFALPEQGAVFQKRRLLYEERERTKGALHYLPEPQRAHQNTLDEQHYFKKWEEYYTLHGHKLRFLKELEAQS